MLLPAVTGALAEKTIGALKFAEALTVRVCELSMPRAVFPVAVSKLFTVTAFVAAMAALAVIGAVEVKVVGEWKVGAALTVSS